MSPLHNLGDQEIQVTISEAESRLLLFGDRLLHGHVVRFAFGLLLLSLVVPILLLRVWGSLPPACPIPVVANVVAPQVTVLNQPRQDSLRNHLEMLRQTNLWELPQDGVVPRVLFDHYPSGADKFSDVDTKKKLFLHTLLPAALIAVNEVRQERQSLDSILTKISRCGDRDAIAAMDFGSRSAFAACLNPEENDFIGNLFRKYRSNSLEQLHRRINILPVSLILAQGAVESSWGGSRFAHMGNSIFGMWTWEEEGMVPRDRDEGKLHKVRTYDSILDSVRDYLLTINRHEAYTPLRMIRLKTQDPLALTDGLTLYSERGSDYIEELKEVIRYNNLQRFDSFRLAARQPEVRVVAGKGDHE